MRLHADRTFFEASIALFTRTVDAVNFLMVLDLTQRLDLVTVREVLAAHFCVLIDLSEGVLALG